MESISKMEVGAIGGRSSLSRYAALSSIASGVIGLVGFGLLLAFFALEAPAVMESGNITSPTLFGVLSNLAGILQMLLLIVVAVALAQPLARADRVQHPGLRRAGMMLGLAGIVAMSAATGLTTLRIGAVGQVAATSMLGLGAIGLWLIISNYLGRADGTVGPRLAWLGTVVGAGLIVMATSFLAAGGPSLAQNPSSMSSSLVVLAGIAVGTLALQIGLPVWAILLGRTLLRGDRG